MHEKHTQTQEAGPPIHTEGRAGLSPEDNATGNCVELLTKESQVRPEWGGKKEKKSNQI